MFALTNLTYLAMLAKYIFEWLIIYLCVCVCLGLSAKKGWEDKLLPELAGIQQWIRSTGWGILAW